MEPLDFNANLKEESARPTGVRYGLILGLISTVLSVVFIMTNTIDFSGTKSNMLSSIISWGVSIFFLQSNFYLQRRVEWLYNFGKKYSSEYVGWGSFECYLWLIYVYLLQIY